MPTTAHRLSIPRTDCGPEGRFQFGSGFRLPLLVAGPLMLGGAAVCAALAIDRGASNRDQAAVLGAFAIFLALVGGYLLSVLASLWDRVETSVDGLRYVSRWRGAVSVSWSMIDAIRFRPVLQRFEVHAQGRTKPIRLEIQLERIEELVMILAERTFHLRDTATRVDGDARAGRQFEVDEAGVSADRLRIAFEDIADVRVLRVEGAQVRSLRLAAQLRDGSWADLHRGSTGLIERYQQVRQAHVAWLERHNVAVPEPRLRVPPPAKPAVVRLLLSLGLAVLLGVLSGLLRSPGGVARLWHGASERAMVARAVDRFRTSHYADVVALAERHFDDHEPSPENLLLLSLQAQSYEKLGRPDEAITAYERGLPVVRALGAVRAEPYAPMLYQLAILYDARGETRRALPILEEGLRIRPRSAIHRALLAVFHEDLGSRERAVELYRDVLESEPRGSEAYAVARARLTRLGVAPGERPRGAPELTRIELTGAFVVVLVPLNEVDSRLDLAATCFVLEAEINVRCRVASTLRIPEHEILDTDRGQYDAAKVLPRLARSPAPIGPREFRLAVTSHDLFANDSHFLFSASSGPAGRVGVLSSHRLADPLPRYWPAQALLGRRVAIEAVANVGTGLGLPRPTSPRCPLAYPDGLEAVLQKSARLCRSSRDARNELLRALGGARRRIGPERAAAIEAVYADYLLE